MDKNELTMNYAQKEEIARGWRGFASLQQPVGHKVFLICNVKTTKRD